MPGWDEIQRYLSAAWDLMRGKPDALRRLDLSADGFWNSFYAMLLAAPPLLLTWIASTKRLLSYQGVERTHGALIASNALVEIAVWVVPLVALAFAVRRMGIADRFGAYVVASNWASVIIAWLSIPTTLATLLAPETSLDAAMRLAYFTLNLVLIWRLTNSVIAKGPALATGVFLFTLVLAVATALLLQSALGLTPPSP